MSTKKRRYKVNERVIALEITNAVLQQKLPSKFKDPSSFNINDTIRDKKVVKDMLDLGESINIMP